MLVSLLIAIADRDLAERLAGLDSDTFVAELGNASESLVDSERRSAPDLVILDRYGIQASPGTAEFQAAVARLKDLSSPPDIVYLATEDTPEQRAAAVAAGCVAVLDTAAPRQTLEFALLALVRGWRDKAVQLLEAEQLPPPSQLGDFISQSPAMAQTMAVARRICDSPSSVLLLGETGVGKERLARAIHAESTRRDQPFVVVNCGAIPENLIESELFGHEKGAFTGAQRAHRGHFEMAHGGTIMLDEIGDLPLHLQVKLLRVIQERVVQRVGAENAIAIDVRVISATNRDLKIEVSEGRFRSDLFYRIGVVTLTIPPLRERREDIALMVRTNLERLRIELNASARRVSPAAMDALQNYSWPGNVREVVNVVERAVLLCDGDEIQTDDLPEDIAGAGTASHWDPGDPAADSPIEPLHPSLLELSLRDAKRVWNDHLERSYLDGLLGNCRGRINETAARAGIDPRSLYDKMRRLGLHKEAYKSRERTAGPHSDHDLP